jgi:hypothetical protein
VEDPEYLIPSIARKFDATQTSVGNRLICEHIGGVELHYGGYCHAYIKNYRLEFDNKDLKVWSVLYLSAQMLVNWKSAVVKAVKGNENIDGYQVIMFIDYVT